MVLGNSTQIGNNLDPNEVQNNLKKTVMEDFKYVQ